MSKKDTFDDEARLAYSFEHVRQRAMERYNGLVITKQNFLNICNSIRTKGKESKFLVTDGPLQIYSVQFCSDSGQKVSLVCVWNPSYFSGKGLVSTLLPPLVASKLKNK